MGQMRLDHFLASEGTGSRSELKKMIRAGRVRVNGEAERSADRKIDPGKDRVELDGRSIAYLDKLYVMMNKPAGVISATKDGWTKTVISLISEPWADRLFPAGRLDKDTEGFMLLTNDGDLAHRLLSPSRHVSKTYFAIVSAPVTEADIQSFREGIDIGEKKKTAPAVLMPLTVDGDFIEAVRAADKVNEEKTVQVNEPENTDTLNKPENAVPVNVPAKEARVNRPGNAASVNESEKTVIESFCLKSIALADFDRCGDGEACVAVSITEGKFHQIKRMFEARGKQVVYLKRIAMGHLPLDRDLKSGQYRLLTEPELELLKRL